MSGDGQDRTVAETRRSRWPGWIWAVPIAAIAVAAWLGIRALARGGEEVVVTFDAVHGMKEHSTEVTYRGLKVGEVSKIKLAPDGRRVEVTLKLDGDVDRFLRAGTRFWLVGGKFSLTDISDLKAMLTGPEIAMEPGPGARTKRFDGLDEPPAVKQATPGSAYVLTADKMGSLQQGSPVYYAGQSVGVIEDARLIGPHQFRFHVFVRAPYDRLVRQDVRFWDASAVRVGLTGQGVKAQVVSPEALLAGAVAFDAPPGATPGPQAAAGQSFALYPGKDAAENAPIGPQVEYVVRFDGAVGDLVQGAAVRLRGFRVGQVLGTSLEYDPAAGALDTPVRIELEPARLHLRGTASAGGDWRPEMDAMLRRLVARGLRARLTQAPPVIGGREVELAFVPGVRRARLSAAGETEQIPSAASADVATIEAKASEFMSKLDRVPIDEIGDNVRQITAHVRALVSSPKLSDSLDHIDSSAAEVDRVIHQAGPQVAPMIKSLRQTADRIDSTAAAAQRLVGGDAQSQDRDLPSALHQLTEAARSIRVLADELERHPEALIKGKGKPRR
jgi:paraquat-inducible protein B